MNEFSLMQRQSDEQLIQQIKSLVQKEKEITAEVLRYLKAIESRKLYLTLGHPSQ